MYNRFSKDEKGFTGLEAAIVLIAFVVVAAVFSYVMLGAGFFTTQKSQEVVHTGVSQASSSIALSGDVVVRGADQLDNAGAAITDAGNAGDQITFYLTNTAGGTPVDLDKTILTYTDDNNSITKSYAYDNATHAEGSAALGAATVWTDSNGWLYNGIIVTDAVTTAAPQGGKGDNLLSPGEKYKVVVDLPTLIGTTYLPNTNEKFTIQLKPASGPVLIITRTLPAALVKDNYYPVY